jgi:alpha-tubulin suppressor-like RCC1 family protein
MINRTLPVLFLTTGLLLTNACKKPFDLLPETAGSAHTMSLTLAPVNLQVFTLAGDGSTAILNSPTGVAVDSRGNAYVTDAANNRIRKITPEGIITTLAGSGVASFVNGNGTAATFNHPSGIAIDKNDNLFVADNLNHAIRKITQAGDVTTYAGIGQPGYTEGPGSIARFNGPTGIAIDTAGIVYVADAGNQRIRKIATDGLVMFLAGDGNAGYSDLPGRFAEFDTPQGLAVDNNNIIYVADKNNHVIRSITQAGAVNTFAGGAGEFNEPTGVATDASRNVYVADRNHHQIKMVTPAGVVNGWAGTGNTGSVDGNAASASFWFPTGIAASADGEVWVADQSNNRIRKIVVPVIATPVAAGAGHNLLCKADFSLWGCGFSNVGQLGDGSTATHDRLVKLMDNVQSVATGGLFTLVLKRDKSLWGTGYNAGNLGDGTKVEKHSFIKIMDNVKSMAASSYNHSLILKTDNSLWATGLNITGPLGDGTNVDKTIPVKIMDNVKAVAAGADHSLIIKTDNSLWATGSNFYGQLGDGTNTQRLSYVKIMDNVKAIAAGREHSLFVKTDNSLWATGGNSEGQLGDGTYTSRNIPVKIMDDVKTVAVGEWHSVILKTDNSVWTTGENNNGRLGDGNSIPNRNTPVKTIDNVLAISASLGSSMAYKTDGSYWTTGFFINGSSFGSTTWVQVPPF